MAYTEKYVSVAGGGSHDGTSAANAWTLAEAIAAPVASGTRVNILSGTYTLAANLTLTSGVSESPIIWQGYATTAGDLESLGRGSATGELTTADFPLIDCGATYNLTMGQYGRLTNLNITGGLSGNLVVGAVGYTVFRCKLHNSHTTSNSCRAFFAGSTTGYGGLLDCDLSYATNGTFPSVANPGRGQIVGCRIWNTHSTPSTTSYGVYLGEFGASLIDSIIYNVGVVAEIASGANVIYGNSWYKVNVGLSLNIYAPIVSQNVGWLHTGYAITGGATGGNPFIWKNALGSYSSGRISTAALGSIIEELDGITLSDSPFTDAASGDFTLNNTASAGASCRAASDLWGGYADLGAVQHQDAGGGGGSALHLGSLGQTGIGSF